jgi:hypothetical protein
MMSIQEQETSHIILKGDKNLHLIGSGVDIRGAAIVATSSDSNDNRSPRHPDTPQHFVCN